jgi:ketosteroid isomerase-like protein
MSVENVEIFRRSVEAFNDRDLDTLDALTSESFEFAPYLATLIETTTYRGHPGLRRYLRDADAAWEQIEAHLKDAREIRAGVVFASGELYGRGRASGLEVRLPLWWLGEIRGGKLASVRSYQSEAQAREAAGAEG